MTSPALVAFDLGGVLVDVDLDALGRSLRCPMPLLERAFFGDGRHDALTVGQVDDERYISAAAKVLGVDAAVARTAWADVVRVRHGAASLVERVSVDVVAWSNTDAVHVSVMAPLLPTRLFRRETRAFSYELSLAKPDARYFVAALDRTGLKRNEVLFLDDRADNVAAAVALGIEAYVVSSLADVTRVLKRRSVLFDDPPNT